MSSLPNTTVTPTTSSSISNSPVPIPNSRTVPSASSYRRAVRGSTPIPRKADSGITESMAPVSTRKRAFQERDGSPGCRTVTSTRITFRHRPLPGSRAPRRSLPPNPPFLPDPGVSVSPRRQAETASRIATASRVSPKPSSSIMAPLRMAARGFATPFAGDVRGRAVDRLEESGPRRQCSRRAAGRAIRRAPRLRRSGCPRTCFR